MIDHYSSAREMLAALSARKISASDLLELHIGRIQAHDSAINAVVVRDFERAREQAKTASATASDSQPLAGLPMTIKESINISGLPTCAGIEQARNFVSAHDGLTAHRLKSAGAVLMGKTNIPVELADWQSNNPVYGRTCNPYRLDRSPGGSSGGSSAALAAGFTPLEVGSDIGGSVRVPAAFCGVFGHRPSETALARSGQFPVPPMYNPMQLLGVQGPMARTPGDLRLAMDVLAGPEIGEEVAWQIKLPAPRREKLKEYRVAMLPTPEWVPMDPSIRQAKHALIESLATEGCQVTEAQPDAFGDWREYWQLYMRLLGAMLGARAPADVRAERIAYLKEVDNDSSLLFCDGMSADVQQLFAWIGQRNEIRLSWQRFFKDFDVVVAPAVMRNAYEHIDLPGSPIISAAKLNIEVDGKTLPYTEQLFYPGLCTLPGLPSTAFPVGKDPDGLPIGLQAIGPYLEDHTPLHFLECLEQAGISNFSPPPSLASSAAR
ncbi:MAG: amidase family protein [Burkholderiaceae bacterium]